jgi:5-methylcytosine-specific restriction enzyme A
MHIVFNKGDKEYFKWMIDNPNGFILNTTTGKGSSYLVLHKSNCIHITKDVSPDDKGYTMRTYIKVASNDANDIASYCKKNRSKFTGKFKLCKTCQPNYINREIIYPDDIEEDKDYREIIYPDDIEEGKNYKEGSKKTVTVNAYERNSNARRKCIKIYGLECKCCGLDFEKKYGEIGKEFIHVHHIKSLSEIGKKYEVDPVKDLIPLCPNCHAMIHRGNPVFTPDELRDIISRNSG